MSSIGSSFVKRQEELSRFIKLESPCYDDSNINRLFPFIFINGMLDITYEGNSFKATMVDITGVSPNNQTDTMIYIMGGPRLVTSIGQNFKAYIRAWLTGTIDEGSPIGLYQPCQIIRVQEADLNNITAIGSETYLISEIPPVSDFFTAGVPSNNYYTTFVFKTPLTVTFVEDGITKYLTFRTVFEQE